MRQNRKGGIRKNLVVSPVGIKELQRLLDVGSESEAVCIAVEDRLLAEKLASTADRIAKRGGLVDLFERSAGSRRRRLHPAYRGTQR
jgi:hypothetical protein